MMIANERKEHVTAIVLSSVAGYVDTAGFLALFGLFTAHVTGNFVTAGAAVALRAPEGVAARLAMIPIFMLAVAGTTLGARRLKARGRAPLAPLLGVMTVALAAFAAAGVLLQPRVIAEGTWEVIAIGGLGGIAMGIQNALMRECFGSIAPTTVMTGNLTQLTMELVDFLVPAAEPDAAKRATLRTAAIRRLYKFGIPLCGFVAGAAIGALLTGMFGLWSIALPTVVVALLARHAAR